MTPDDYRMMKDIHQQVGFLTAMNLLLYFVIGLATVIGLVVLFKVFTLLKEVRKLISLIEIHSRLTDSKGDKVLNAVTIAGQQAIDTANLAAKVAKVANETTAEVKQAVENVPSLIIEKLSESTKPPGSAWFGTPGSPKDSS